MIAPRRSGLAIALAALVLSAAAPAFAQEADKPKGKPIKALLVLGGCCHDYPRQAQMITRGISERANVEWTVALDPDKGTTHLNPVYGKDDWAMGFDVVVHDECSSDVKDAAVVERILKPHKEGLPAVVLHCAMHSFRGEGYPKATAWFAFTGLHSNGHGDQLPIAIDYVAKDHPIVKGLENWTTGKEELYNNLTGRVNETATALATGKQSDKGKDAQAVVTWVNTYNGKAKVFGTTLGHNNATVGDPRYLNLITRGLLWSVGKLDEEHFKAGDEPAEATDEKGGAKAGAKPRAAGRGELLKAVGDRSKADANAAGADADAMVPIDLARGKRATASSVQNENTPEGAVDGDVATRWCAQDGSVPHRFQVDLGKPQTVAAAKITWEKDDALYWFRLEGSADGTTATRYRRAELVESIIKPNAKSAQGFETHWFRTADVVVEGFITREAGDEVEFRNAAGVTAILKAGDVTRRGKRETSIMPEGLAAKLSPEELASLVAYLESLKAK